MKRRTFVALGLLALAFAGCESVLGLGHVHFIEAGVDVTDVVRSDATMDTVAVDAIEESDAIDELPVDAPVIDDAPDVCTMVCGGACVDTLTDPHNCGACGMDCVGPHVTVPTCTAGTCNVVCDPGFGDCDGVASNGCEIDLTMASNHCGTCANACTAPHAFGSCAGGNCSFACNTGFADCNGMNTDGCEADLTHATSCGSCGNVCPSTDPTCVEPGSVPSASRCCRVIPGALAGCLAITCNPGESCFAGTSVYCCL